MKESIMGYITALINIRSKNMERITTSDRRIIESFIYDLNGLLDFVEDIPEDKQPITVILGRKR